MKLVLERKPWHTVWDTKPRYMYDAVFTVHGVTIRSCRLNAKQVEILLKAKVELVCVPCRTCKTLRCTCLRGRKPRNQRLHRPPHTRTKANV